VPRGPAMQRTVAPRKLRTGRFNTPGLSPDGLAFLKCAFAAPDFSVDPGKGIPDRFEGNVLCIKDCATTSIAFTAAKDTYIIVAPIPGYSYFKAEVDIGVEPTTFTGVPYATYDSNFGTGATISPNSDCAYESFRYASTAAGLYPTCNYMQFSGSIQAWRVDLRLGDAIVTVVESDDITRIAPVKMLKLLGAESITSLAPRENYSDNFINGVYTYAFDRSNDFTWQPFAFAPIYRNGDVTAADRQFAAATSKNLTGLGNLNTLVYKVSTPASAVNTAILKTWCCLEMQPRTDSVLYQFAGLSPPHDQVALDTYSCIKNSFPVAVPVRDNPNFWNRVRTVIGRFLGGVSKFAPQIGALAGAVSNLII
jgi:hypothetical protein